jgi:Big-like domain-containing protein
MAVNGTAPFVGTTAPFMATATLSNSASQRVTTQAAWSSSNTTIATVSNDGTVTGVAAGDVDITATYQNVAGHAHLTITSVPNYQGVWSGNYTVTACDGVNGLCDPGDLGVGTVYSTYLNLMQNGTTVTGYTSIGLGLPVLRGGVDGYGHLVLSGTWSCGCGLGSTKYTGTISDLTRWWLVHR